MKPCSGCKACCVLFTIPEQPRMTPCKHRCETGCGIHADPRPAICTDFACSWCEEPSWGDEHRPDKNKIIFMHRQPVASIFGNARQVYAACMFSRYAHLRRENRRLIDKLVFSGKVVLLNCVDVDDAGCPDKYWSFFKKDWFPQLTTEVLVEHCRLGHDKAIQAVNDFYAV